MPDTLSNPSGWAAAFDKKYQDKAEQARKRRDYDRLRQEYGGRRLSDAAIEKRRRQMFDARAHVLEDHLRCQRERPSYKKTLDMHTQFLAETGDKLAQMVYYADNAEAFAEAAAQRRKETKDAVHRRQTVGFEYDGGCVGDNPEYRRDAFTYQGLVSTEHPIFRAFVTKLPKRQDLRAGWKKSDSEPSQSKLLSCDEPYIGGGKKMVGFTRHELDEVFQSWDDLKAKIVASRCPLPNTVVGHQAPDGRILRPHLIWLLEKSVCATENGRKGPQALLAAVSRGLCKLLIPIGADTGALSNPLRVKNPLSPLWSTQVLVEEPYRLQAFDKLDVACPLPDLASQVDVTVSMDDLERLRLEPRNAPDHSDPVINAEVSNRIWQEMRVWANRNVRRIRDEEKSTLEAFTSEVTEVGRCVMTPYDKITTVAKKALSVAKWAWTNVQPVKAKLNADEVRLRQSVGCRVARQNRHAKNVQIARDAVESVLAAGAKLTKAEVAHSSGLHRNTVDDCWDDAVANKVLPTSAKLTADQVRERRSASAKETTSAVVNQNIKALRDGVAAVLASGAKLTKTAVARASGLHRNTIRAYWEQVAKD